MISRVNLNLIAQILDSMNDISAKLDEACKNQKSGDVELAKKELLGFQRKLAQELNEVRVKEN